MTEASNTPSSPAASADVPHEGRLTAELDIDRMVNEGLGGGQVTLQNGRIGATTTDERDDASNEAE